jgi:GABA(A) receptor-associated protein
MPIFSATSAPSSPTTTRKLKPFKSEKTFEQRKAECTRVREKYPDMIPVICERHTTSSTLPQSERRKYLVPLDITMGQFKYVIRKRIKMRPDEALFIFVDGSVLCPTMTSVGEMYKEHRDEDGFMYLVYSGESTFG